MFTDLLLNSTPAGTPGLSGTAATPGGPVSYSSGETALDLRWDQAGGAPASIGADGIYRDADGQAVGIRLGFGSDNTLVAADGTVVGSTSFAGPKLTGFSVDTTKLSAVQQGSIPGPGLWQAVNESMSPAAAAYQAQITGRTGQVYVVNGVKFDRYDPATGLQDAKGPGYASFVKDGKFMQWFTGAPDLVDQAERQLAAAGNTPITWYVADPEAVTAIKNLFQNNDVEGINVVPTLPKTP